MPLQNQFHFETTKRSKVVDLQIGVWFNNYFLYRFVSSSNWNNQEMDGHQVLGRNDDMQKRITKVQLL